MEKVKIDDVLKYEQPTNYLVENEDYNDSFETPVLTAGKTFLLGKTNEKSGIYNNVPVIIFDDFTTAFHYVDFPFKVKSSAMKILKNVEEKSDLKYLYYKMQTISIDTNLHKRYWISKYSQIKIKLPPLPAQQKIAAILDQADAIIQNNRAIVQKYDALTQSLFLDMFGDPVKNEKGWETDKVVNVCSKIFGGGTPSKAKPEYFIGNIPWVTPKDMKSEYIFDSIDHVNLKAIENSSAKLIPSGNLLMVIRSGILKHTLPLAINKVDVTVNQDMKAFIPNAGKTNTIFLKYFFQCSSSYLLGKVRAVTADNIEFNQIKELSFPLVPINLQNQFAERVQAIDVQKQQAQLELAKSEELFQSLLQRAFNGELS